MTPAPPDRHLVLSDDASVPAAIEAFRDYARQRQLSPRLVNDFSIILDELLSNIIRHGYRDRSETPAVEISLMAADGSLEVEIVDSAPRFNMLERDDPRTDQSISERTIGGLGIYLVKKLSDEVRYDYSDGRNRLTIRKRL